MGILRNYRLFRVQRLCRKQEYKKALTLAQRLLAQTPDSVVANTILADVLLFSRDLEKALPQYGVAGSIVQTKKMDAKDKRYLAAYINSRILAHEYNRAGKLSRYRTEIASIVNGLEAHKNLKSLFLLPE
jgi:predicted Zn-dependent protease